MLLHYQLFLIFKLSHEPKAFKINKQKFVSTNWVRVGPLFRRGTWKLNTCPYEQDGGWQWSPWGQVRGKDSEWSLFFTDLDELLCEYEQHQSTSDISLKENLTIRLEKAVQALQNLSPFVSDANREQFSKWPGIFSWCFGTAIEGVNFPVEQDAHK